MRVKDKKIKKRDADRTSRIILEAAIKEFTECGLGGARVDRIAEKAGVNKRMLYHYYGNKDDLFLAALEEEYARIRSAELELDLEHLSPKDAIRNLIQFTWDYYLKNPSFLALLNTENLHKAVHINRSDTIRTMHSPLVEMIEKVLKSGAQTGEFRNNIDPVQLYVSIAALGYFYLSNSHTLSSIFGRQLLGKEALEERHRHIADVILGYLSR